MDAHEKTKQTHTPGPWKVDGCWAGDNRLICHGDEDENSPIIAEIMNADGGLPRDANAALIAASPALLAALEGIELQATQARLASQIGKQAGKADFLRNEMERIGKAARAAIRTATESGDPS